MASGSWNPLKGQAVQDPQPHSWFLQGRGGPSVLNCGGPVSCLLSVVWDAAFWQSGLSLGSLLQSSNGFSFLWCSLSRMSQALNYPKVGSRSPWLSVFSASFYFSSEKTATTTKTLLSHWRAPGSLLASLTELCLPPLARDLTHSP